MSKSKILTFGVIVLVALVYALSCEGKRTTDAIDMVGAGPDMADALHEQDSTVFAGDEYSGVIYRYCHPVGKEKVDRMRYDEEYAGVITHYETEDYQQNLQRSKYIKTETIFDGSPIDMIVLVMERADVPDGDQCDMVLRYAVIAGVALSFHVERIYHGDGYGPYFPAGEDPIVIGVDQLGRSIRSWSYTKFSYFLHTPSGAPALDPPIGDPGEWDMDSWLECLFTATAAECAATSFGCLLSAEPWDDCTEEGCRYAPLGAAIRCTLNQFGWY